MCKACSVLVCVFVHRARKVRAECARDHAALVWLAADVLSVRKHISAWKSGVPYWIVITFSGISQPTKTSSTLDSVEFAYDFHLIICTTI